MKSLSRILSMLLCLALALSACGGETSSAASSSAGSPATPSPAPGSSAAAPSAPPKELIGPTGCKIGGGISDTTAAKKGDPDTLEIVMGQDTGNIDPANNGLIIGMMIQKQIYDTLIMKDPITGEFIPGLATFWEWADNTHIRFTLREGVKFHNGEDFTAEDVMATIARFQGSSATGALYKCFSYEESSIVSDYEVIIGFSEEFAPAMNYITHVRASIVPADYLEANGPEALYQVGMGTGAYKFQSWNVGSDTTLVRNDSWWGLGEYGDCYFKTIHITHSADESARIIALEAGDADLCIQLGASDYDRLDSQQPVDHLLTTQVVGIQANAMVLNYHSEVLQNIKVREALALGVEWAKAVKAVGGSTWSPLTTTMAPTIFGYTEIPPYEYNPERSRQLLEEAGYGEGLTITCIVAEGSSVKLFEVIQAYLADVGVTLDISVTDQATWRSNCDNGLCDTSIGNMTAMTLDPAHALLYTYSTNPTSVGNMALISDKYSELWYKAQSELNEGKRAELYAEMQHLVHDEFLTLPLYVPNQCYAYWDYLDNVIPDPGIQLDCRVISLKTN